jgi:hypothetical protein
MNETLKYIYAKDPVYAQELVKNGEVKQTLNDTTYLIITE